MPQTLSSISFVPVAPEHPYDSPGLDVLVDGRPLRELVEEFEKGQGYEAAGGYELLYPREARDLAAYLRGEDARQYPEPGVAWVLMCGCGEAGCWPLETTVTCTESTVTWSDFCQPHRPRRSYEGFGPFTFDRRELDEAVARAVGV